MGDFDDAWSRISGKPVEPALEPEKPERHDLIEPSEEEKRNGYDAESLAKYRRERDAAAYARIEASARRGRRQRPARANGPKWSFGPAAVGTSWQIKGRNFGPWAKKR